LEESGMGIVSLTKYIRGRFSDRFPPPRVGPLGERLIPPGEQRFTAFQDLDPVTARVASGQQEARKAAQPWDGAGTPGSGTGVPGESGFWVTGGEVTPLTRGESGGWKVAPVARQGLKPDGVPWR
jgi:hypothetical protein